MRQADGILPDFIVIGAMRAATTTLYMHLSRHPKIGMSHDKETDFFIENGYEAKWASYHAQWEPGFERYGEVSPNYSKRHVFPMAARRIAADLPDCKLIYIVRDPVDRLVSHYKHLQQVSPSVPEPSALMESEVWRNLLDASLYARQIEVYRGFYDAGRLLVVDFDRLSRETETVLGEIGAFIGVPDGWAAVLAEGAGAANTSGELSRIPRWALKLNEGRRLSGLKRLLPSSVITGLRRFIARGEARPALSPTAAALTAAREEIAPDAAALRRLTGQAFAHWSV